MWSPNGPSIPTSSAVDPALEHDLRVRRHLEVDGLALDELHGRALEEAGDHQLADVLRQRCARRVGGDRVEAERDGDRDPAVGRRAQVGAAVLVDLPVHERRAPVDLLHPVHADVAHAGLPVLRDHRRERDERGRVERPAALDREQRRGSRRRPSSTISWQAAFETSFGIESAIDLSLPSERTLSTSPCGGCSSRISPSFVGEVVELLDAEGHAHALLGPELVDQERDARALRVLEQERRPAGLDDAVDDLGDLEVGVDLGRDADELALLLEERDPLAEVGGGARPSAVSLGSGATEAFAPVRASASSRPVELVRARAAG